MIEPQDIITMKDLNKNLVAVQNALNQGQSKFLFDRNEPKAVLMGLRIYESLTRGNALPDKALAYYPDPDFSD